MAAHEAGWYGTSSSPEYLFPFAAAFGGIAQFAAALFAYRARDGLATAMHGTWGSFWIGYGILYLLIAVGALTAPTGAWEELGFWFFALAVITAMGAIAAAAENLALTVYTASAMMFEATYGRVILPLGKYSKTANIPGGVVSRPVQYEYGEPGVRQGQ